MILRFAGNRNFWIMLACDCLLIIVAYYLSFFVRFDGDIPLPHLEIFCETVVWILPLKLVSFFFFDMYKGMWRYFGLHDVFNILKACTASSVAVVIVVLAVFRFVGFSRSVFAIDFILCLMFVGSARLLIRLAYSPLPSAMHFRNKRAPVERVLIIGAGDAGEKLLREIRDNTSLTYDVVGFVDDDPSKWRKTLHGVPVLGPVRDLRRIVEKHQVGQIVIAIPSADAGQMRTIIGYCRATEVPYKTLPSLGDLIDGNVSVSSIREVRYEDLLGRAPVELEMEAIGAYLRGKNVLVTGGAGSIGSELCRQIAAFAPARLIIVELNESGLYDIELRLKERFPGIQTVAVLGAIQDKARMDRIFSRFAPQVVFHGAAYKHVPMLELNPCEAVFNNIMGSKVIMELCLAHGLERCVVVSTDKAVRPTNVMGASKRVTEVLAQCFARENQVKFMAVRFGNVLGSVGSVLPLFERQIAQGGPVTVTHPEVMRYFMTIPEASSLILQAGAFGRGGELFVLKMGTAVRIDTMARDLITLSGLQPDLDIQIKYTGLRPGEKLYEELITAGEDIQPTRHKDIMVLRSDQCPPMKLVQEQIQDLVNLADAHDICGIKKKLCEMVPEYRPDTGRQAPEDEGIVVEKRLVSEFNG